MNGKNALLSLAVLSLLILNLTGQDNGSLAMKALNDTAFTWKTIAANRIKIYYQLDSFAERHRMMILRSVTTAVDEVLDLLQEPKRSSALTVFYFDSREELKRVVGHPYAGYADYSSNAIFIVLNPEWRSFEKHEFTHLVTLGGWGSPHAASQWMIEGICIYSDGWCREYTVDEIAFHLLSNDQLPHLQELSENFAALGEIRAGISAGSFIGFIAETYGVDKLRSLWSEGAGNIEKLLGNDLDQIETSWRSYLRQNVKTNIQLDVNTIDELKCG